MLLNLISALSMSLSSCASTSPIPDSPVKPVQEVNLEKYQGLWYEVALIPNSFQKRCVSDTTAQYQKLSNGTIEVTNICLQEDGSKESIVGRAKIADSSNAKLKVTFVSLFKRWIYAFGGDYWVLALEPNYKWAFVGTPSRKFGWVLSRTPRLYPQEVKAISEAILAQGYNPCDFISKSHGDQTEVRGMKLFCNP